MEQVWIKQLNVRRRECVAFSKRFSVRDGAKIKRAVLSVTATGVYVATLNGERVSFPLAPGADSYHARLRLQKYDVTSFLKKDNVLGVVVGGGWFDWGGGWLENEQAAGVEVKSLFCELLIEYSDGAKDLIAADESWKTVRSKAICSTLYDGERYDASVEEEETGNAAAFKADIPLVYEPQCEIREQERLKPVEFIVSPKGEKILDFGQNLTGYLEFTVTAKKGDKVKISHAETLDKEGNFYTENYRTAKALIEYVCKDGKQTYKPILTFYGFRYIRLDEFPADVDTENFTAIVVHSDLKRTGYIRTSNPLLDRLFLNTVWGQKGNFLDIPTDCPQRDERQGWTGDAQVFCRAANYNFDCEEFFARWFRNLRAEQKKVGYVPRTVPNYWGEANHDVRAAWADAATVCPWEVYRAYGNKSILEESFDSMKAHVDYIGTVTKDEYLWTGGAQYGDWLGLDAPTGSYKGSSDDDFIASAFYAYSTRLTIETGKEIGKDVSKYEELYRNIRKKINETYPEPKTQTECVLLLHFDLTDEKEKIAKTLVQKIVDCGNHLQTGFVGTPYLLHALSENGYAEKAYELLLREQFPSWLYSVKCGATTIWEHWDGKNENGEFWDKAMNSFNHYAYGSVADWLYGVAAGITPLKAGYEKVQIAPVPTDKLDFFEAEYFTRHGRVYSKWEHVDGKVCYTIETPVDAVAILGGKRYELQKGVYRF